MSREDYSAHSDMASRANKSVVLKATDSRRVLRDHVREDQLSVTCCTVHRSHSIGRMLTEAAFDLAAVKALTTAYEDVLATLGLKMRTDPLTQMIARKIIEHAQRGERDRIRLRESVLKELEGTGR